PEEGEPLEAGGFEDRLEVTDSCLDREVVDVPVGHPEAALVVADDGRDLTELIEEVAPDGALPVVLEVAEPARDDDEWRAAAVDRISEADAVGASAETDLLVRCDGPGAFRGRCGMDCHGPAIVRLGFNPSAISLTAE